MNSSNSNRLDPDPFSLAALLLGVLGTSTGIFAAAITHRTAREQRGIRRQERRAAARRWEADLIDLEVILQSLQELIESEAPTGSEMDEGPIQPMESSMWFSHQAMRKYRKLTNRLASHSKRLNDDTFSLLPFVSDEITVSYLVENAQEIKTHILAIKDMRSIAEGLEICLGTVAMLRKVANYMHKELA